MKASRVAAATSRGKFGVVRDSVLSFRSNALYPGRATVFYALAAQLKVVAYFNLGTNLSNRRTWLGMKGPILKAFTEAYGVEV